MKPRDQFVTTNKAMLLGKYTKPIKVNEAERKAEAHKGQGSDINCFSGLTTNQMKFVGSNDVMMVPSTKPPV